MDGLPSQLPLAELHEQLVVTSVDVPDVRDDRQLQGLRIELLCRGRRGRRERG